MSEQQATWEFGKKKHQQKAMDFGDKEEPQVEKPVECLGMTFPSDDARRHYFLDKLREKLQDPEFRKIEGFPIGKDEDILALSDPPYYTACPNPFIAEFVKCYGKPYESGKDDYHREPFAADVSEGKNDPIYNAHSYHTKVPHKAIMRYILHYTEPGDMVFDGFCGTGMTGVAAQLCGNKETVMSLGYKVEDDGTILDEDSKPFSKLGVRQAILNDLSPAATFIAYNYNTPVDVVEFEKEAKKILAEVEKECGWMYETRHTDGKTKGKINYTVWSDVFVCPDCSQELVFWEVAVDKAAGEVRDEFPCQHCNASLTKRKMERSWVTKLDKAIGETIRQAKQVPVLINYSVGKKRHEKVPDAFDLELIQKIEESEIPYWFPTDRMPEGDESRRNDDFGITHVHHFYTKRDLVVISSVLQKSFFSKAKPLLLLSITSLLTYASKLCRWRIANKSGPLSGTLYVSSTVMPLDAFTILPNRFARMSQGKRSLGKQTRDASVMSTHSSTKFPTVHNAVDYIFTDPPFGGNLMYSELNFIWEAWLKIFTNNKPEAIENKTQGKGLPEYQKLMAQCFGEYYRVLKSGHWMTVEFHNSQNRVWNSIQEALQSAGFVIADVRTLDKKQGTFKQVTSGGAVKQDLIISAYKPNGGLEQRFELTRGTEAGVWDFVRTHLKQLPVFVTSHGKVEVVVERLNYLLFDRMVAFHVQRGVMVPMSAVDFYAGLTQKFTERDNMYFLPEQVAEYDKKRMKVKDVAQMQLFVLDEASAILWLAAMLKEKPQTFQDIHPQFMREISGWKKHEKSLELKELLEENFLCYDGNGEVSSQIHSYLSSNFQNLRNLAKDHADLKAKAKDRWYVPDPNKASDLEKLRDKSLLKEFAEYLEQAQSLPSKKLKLFRMEAVRAGFKKAWQEKDYQTIIAVAKKIPETILQEDPKLLMWYDQAVTRTGG